MLDNNILRKPNTYYTRLISWDWSLYPPAPYNGKGWTINFEKTPAIDRSGSVSCGGKDMKQREVVIKARNYNSAHNAFTMINCAFALLHTQLLMTEIKSVIPKDKKEYKKMFSDELRHQKTDVIGTSHFPLSCIIAAKASHRRLYKYALIKFGLASELHSVYWIDRDPSHATEHFGVSPFISNHVRYAYSIIASYSTIEEIGLEIRASATNPSFIDGEWNPKVKNDIEKRLKKAGIDPKETVPWDLRGKPTRIEKSKQLLSKGRCGWAKGPYVRDCKLEIIDAINAASYLRSKISSHKINSLVTSLNSYHVENVRMLARRLLLGSLGFWPPPWRN